MLWESEQQIEQYCISRLLVGLSSSMCTWQTARSESSRPLSDLRMQRRHWSCWATPESLGMDLPDRVLPANRVAIIGALDTEASAVRAVARRHRPAPSFWHGLRRAYVSALVTAGVDP